MALEHPAVEGVRHRFVAAGEVRLHVAEAGDGPLVVLLHGFPHFWWVWRHQLPALAAAGFHAVAPDLRGYNLSDHPAGVASYAVSRVAEDVVALVRALGAEGASLVGHDWGGAVAYAVAERHPELIERLVVMNSPHPARFVRALRRPSQVARSSYMLLFQLPWLPERLLSAGGHALLRAALRGLRATPVTDGELEPYLVAVERAGGLRHALDYYRASVRSLVRHRGLARGPQPAVTTPVLVVWGTRDPVLEAELAPPPRRFLNSRVELVPEAAHDVQVDAPARVNALLLDFLGAPRPG